MDILAAGNAEAVTKNADYEQRITELTKELQDSIETAQHQRLLAEQFQGEVAMLKEQLSSRRFYLSYCCAVLRHSTVKGLSM
jgi:hypothetical protein